MIEATVSLITHSSLRRDPTVLMDPRAAREKKDIDLAQKGDLAAFNALVLAYQDSVYRQAFWMLGQEEAAEDATQEVFLLLYRKLDLFKGGSFKAWLLRIARNYCLDQLRLKKRRPTLPIDACNEYDEEIETPSWLADPSDAPDVLYERKEMRTSILECVGKLSTEYREVITLVDFQEMDYQETANILGIPVGTVKSRLARARLQMRDAIRNAARFENARRPLAV
jgi:RNA polymerase sigma-70 factor (ECF subfamily)